MRFAILAVLCSAPFLRAETPAVPRPAPDFTIQFPGGQTMQLSSFRGKVVALEFLFTTCPHCAHASQVFSKLSTEYVPKGFQPLGVAFNELLDMLFSHF